ncbi:hypothetical protein KKA02_04665, partial [Patescibacteria group bacterium]|nr:hypothetical protein [Patescibacteria group bacterium]
DETTGKIIPAKIKGLLDMGVKPIYQLTTQDGKSIKTTGNHPYLVKTKNSSINSLPQVNTGNIENLLEPEKLNPILPQTETVSRGRQIDQRLGKNHRIGNREEILNFSTNLNNNIGRHSLQTTLSFRSENKLISHKEKTLPATISFNACSYSDLNCSRNFSSKDQSASNLSINLPTGLDSYSPSAILSKSKFSSIRQRNSQKAYLSNKNQAGLSFLSKPTTALHFLGNEAPLGANLENNSTFDLETVSDLDIQANNSKTKENYQTEWTKVIYLSVGDEIAVADGNKLNWQKIKSIEELPPQQVYDIEVEGTHNFVANGIIAHNTYISDKLGIGSTNASYQLNVSGSGNITTNLNIGGTLTLSSIPSLSDNNLVLTSDSGIIKSIDTTSWDKDSSDDYSAWYLQADTGSTSPITTGNTANFVAGTGIGISMSATDQLTITNTSVGTTYAAGSGLTLAGEIFKLGGAITEDTRLNIGSTEAFFIDYSTGHIGIGTTGPNAKLEISGTAFVDKLTLNEDTTYTSSTHNAQIYQSGGHLYISGEQSYGRDIYFKTTNTDRMVIKNSTGSVGIGTTSPLARLHSQESGAKTSANYAGYLQNLSTNSTTDSINKYGLYLSSTGTFVGGTGPNTSNFGLYVDTVSGADNNYSAYFADNVSIGTTNPLTKLHVEGQCITGDSLLPIVVKKDSNHQKTAQRADLVSQTDLLIDWLDTLKKNISQDNSVVNKHQNKKGVDLPRVEPGRLGVSNQSSKP